MRTCISVETSFAAAHYTNPHLSSAGTLHGHNWRVTVKVCKEGVSAWVIDALKLKEKVNEIVEPLQFSILVPEPDAGVWLKPRGLRDTIEDALGIKVRVAVLPYPLVSAETVAYFIYERLRDELEKIDCIEIIVEESPGERGYISDCEA